MVICEDLLFFSLKHRTINMLYFVITKYSNNKQNYTRILIGSLLWSTGGEAQRWRHRYQHFASLSYKTIRFRVAVGLHSYRSQENSKCGKTSVTHKVARNWPFLSLPHVDVIFDLLWTNARQYGIYLLNLFIYSFIYFSY